MATAPDDSTDLPTDDELAINDPEELSQKKRITELLNRRTGVIDARNQAKDEYYGGGISKQQALMVYQSRIESLVIDLWTKFKNKEGTNGKEILTDETIAEVTVYPPETLLPNGDNDLANGADTPDPKIVSINGLQWFIDNDPVVEAPFEAFMWNPPGKRTDIGTTVLDFNVLDQALLKVMEFIDETGIDADFDEDPDDAKMEYNDLLDPEGDDPE